MQKLTTADLVTEIAKLGLHKTYKYVKGKKWVQITHITYPEGPIRIARVKSDGSLGKEGSLSKRQLARIAAVCSNHPNFPLHIDRVFSAGGNTRSALEALLAQTPHFFVCNPARVDAYSGETIRNLKHIMWCPDESHKLGEVAQKEYTDIIAEIEVGIDFGHINVGVADLGEEFETIEAKTTHVQMQIALIEIGRALGFHTWIAKPDQSIEVGNRKLGDFEGVLRSLEDVGILYKKEAKDAATLIDCIWITQDGDHIPAIIEIEHSTGVTSGLTRMLKLKETIPSIKTTFTVAAPNALRNKVISETNQKVFSELNARYMPYTTVRELYGLIQRYHLTGIDHSFINSFMEQVTNR